MKPHSTQLPKSLFPFIGHFLKPYIYVVMVYIFLAVVGGFWGTFNSLLIKTLIDLLPQAHNTTIAVLLIPGILIIINFIVLDNITWRGIDYICAVYTPRIQKNIASETLDYCLSHSHGFYQSNLSGKISKQITNLVDSITTIITSSTTNFLRGASLLISGFLAAYSVNTIFFLILFVWFILFSSFSLMMSKKLVSLSDTFAEQESVVAGELVDSLSNHMNIRIFSRKKYENIRLKPILNAYQKAHSAMYLYSTLLYSLQGGLIALMMACSLFSLIYLYSRGLVSIGDFVLILGISMETGHMIWHTMSRVDEFNQAFGKAKQSLNSLIVPLEITDKPDAPVLRYTKGEIVFKNVTFTYNDAHTLFSNESVTIKAGQKVGLVGYSGGGKSTFVNLIMRLYDTTSGAILIDGQNVEDVTQDSLREAIAMIPQDPALFNRTLMENIRYGRIESSDDEVIEAARKAHAHEFIVALPEGYQSIAGERGVKLSGGQRQRIAIARAILKNAPILILDEATSQLDSLTEELIQQSLWELMKGKTTLVIAHRLSTLVHMDRILVVRKGKIVEDGTHTELLRKNGLYKKLWDAQVGGFLGDTNGE